MKLVCTTETADAITHEYASEDGARLTVVSLKEPSPAVALRRSQRLTPGTQAATAAFRNGDEELYIDMMRHHYEGEW